MTLVQPTGEISAKIREELREPDAETFNKDVAAIREWLEKQPHLPKDMGNFNWNHRWIVRNDLEDKFCRIHYDEFNGLFIFHGISLNTKFFAIADEGRLRTFLRGCKFSPEKVKQKLDMYYTMRNAVPEFFADRDISRPELAEVLDIADMPPLPGLTPNGCRVVCLRAIERDNMPDNVAHGMKVAMMIGDLRLKMEEVGVAGDVYILDASAATPAQFAKFTPSLVKKFLICVQEAYPVRLKEIHVVNISPLVDKIMTFVKPFLKEKIRDRIFLHSNIEDLYKYVPKEMLPSEYGGGAGPIKNISGEYEILYNFDKSTNDMP